MDNKQVKRAAKWYDSPLNTRIRELIADRGVNTTDISKRLGVSVEAVRQWCSGYARPDIDKLTDIADFFMVSYDYLFGRTNCPSPDIETQAICEKTGLSLSAIENLRKWKAKDPHFTGVSDLLTHERFAYLLDCLHSAGCASKKNVKRVRAKILADNIGYAGLWRHYKDGAKSFLDDIITDTYPEPSGLFYLYEDELDDYGL